MAALRVARLQSGALHCVKAADFHAISESVMRGFTVLRGAVLEKLLVSSQGSPFS